ncbi:MAG: aspartate carbamoyltransferase, partial [Gammaproteobacteria bacterium]|nr:aspartate carbamoyltransferase [Gammaproteobacteria bacterium]MCW5583614.1 aspartate carbamoyltransferase [Gammaproteobacteria bacterium]
MENTLYGCDIVSMQDLPLSRIQLILEAAARLKEQRTTHLLANKIIAHCFFEPSTRTRLSFETATLRLGGSVVGFSSDEALSIQKGETLHDTIRMVTEYADLIIIRHPKEGAARLAADVSSKPVVNAGDGANQHPTQALLDLFTIQECQQRLDGLAIALVGDLKYGRAIHSFAQACMLFDVRLFLVAPDSLALPESICNTLKKVGVRFSFHQSIEEVIPKIDILYMTRIQQERFSEVQYQQVGKQYILTPKMLSSARPNLKILHPLPRVNEIEVGVDLTPYAHYFEQAANGIYVRQALLSLLLNKSL